jgi:nicotinate-nucleotide pyrophosphorylase (carboxylating)
LKLSSLYIEEVVTRALDEDCAWTDVTSHAVVPPETRGRASIMMKTPGVVAGLEVAQAVFLRVDPSLNFRALINDGQRVKVGDPIATVEGRLASILAAERTALNFLQRLSGIATETRRYVDEIAGLKARIVDTRKTTPGLRLLEKYAVETGGGHNHRLHLGDGILIKDNHLAALRSQGMTLADAVTRAKANAPHTLRIEVEVEKVEEARQAVEASADIVMLDNMSPEEMRRAVGLIAGRALAEASGGITLANVRQVAETGVDLISVGAITHSVKALDISLEVLTP